MTTQSDLIRLQQSVRESRSDLSREYSGLVHELDFRRRFSESVKRHPLGWIGGAVSAGLLATLFGTGSSKKTASPAAATATVAASTIGRAGWIAGALEVGKILYPVVKPILMPVVTELLGNITRSGLAKKGRLP
jgi:hypothetical protein